MAVDYLNGGVLTDGAAWVPLQTSGTLSGNDALVTFSSTTGKNNWSQYMDLVILSYCRTTHSAASISALINFNNNSDTDVYRTQWFYGTSTSAVASGQNETALYLLWCAGAGANANVFSTGTFQIFDVNSGKHKSTLCSFADDRYNEANSTVGVFSGTWKKDQAINELDITAYGSQSFVAGSRFDLYGVLPRMVV